MTFLSESGLKAKKLVDRSSRIGETIFVGKRTHDRDITLDFSFYTVVVTAVGNFDKRTCQRLSYSPSETHFPFFWLFPPD